MFVRASMDFSGGGDFFSCSSGEDNIITGKMRLNAGFPTDLVAGMCNRLL